ncbi:hypothetical protein [Szabonella alba]|uniref:Uncharacterized protein n=1 Tax=Szabonella alba TaxID=2804194 RepID=A0A8K0V9K3_9RHOB|nr:hypothetical protein [Szabonella alba]MBL4915779.1 hypothetical protein [Szabonella alba]
MLYLDIPTDGQLRRLAEERGDAHVSLYIPTTPETQSIGQARIELGNLLKQAIDQLEAAGTPKRTMWPIEEQVADLMEDDTFWRHQAHSLAIFVSPDRLRSFRLPNRLQSLVQVSDRFHLKPLFRAVSVEQHAFVLALAENDVRLIEVFADAPAQQVRVADMPRDAASASGSATVNSRSYSRRLGGSEGQNVLLRAYCRRVDEALRPVLMGRSEPLILAATDPLASMFRNLCSHEPLAGETIRTSPGQMTPDELATEARPILDGLHVQRLKDLHDVYSAREAEGRATTQLDLAARAATHGAVETLLVDIDGVVPGTVDEITGAVTLDKEDSASTYGVVDEIAGRVLAMGGDIVAVRKEDIPGGAPLAAILRYAV